MKMIELQVQEALNQLEVFPEVQRKLSPARVKSLKAYIDEGVRGSRRLFLPPLVVNERGTGVYSVNDGQHRFIAIKGLEEDYLKDLEKWSKKAGSARATNDERLEAAARQAETAAKRAALHALKLGLQVYEGLSEDEERQLFADVNFNVSKPPMSLGASFDTSSLVARIMNEVLSNLPNLDAEIERGSMKLVDKLMLFTTARKGAEILLGKNLDEDLFETYVQQVTTMYSIYMDSLPADAKSDAYFYTYASNLFAVARYSRDLMALSDQGVAWDRTLRSTFARVRMEHSNPLFATIGNVPVDGNGKLVFTGTGSAVPAILAVLRACTSMVDAKGGNLNNVHFKTALRIAGQEAIEIGDEPDEPAASSSGQSSQDHSKDDQLMPVGVRAKQPAVDPTENFM
jgi:hypothetical protein